MTWQRHRTGAIHGARRRPTALSEIGTEPNGHGMLSTVPTPSTAPLPALSCVNGPTNGHIFTAPSCGSRGGAKGTMARPVPVKTKHKKDGRHRWPLLFMFLAPPPSPPLAILDQMLAPLPWMATALLPCCVNGP